MHCPLVCWFLASIRATQSLSAAGNFLGEPINSLIFATILNIVFTIVFALGIKKTFRILNVLWSITILGTVVMIVSLALTHLSSFEDAFNGYVRSVNGTGTVSNPFAYVQSASYSQLGSGLVLPAIAICASSVIWVFWETYVAGEVRRSGIAKRNFSTMGGAADHKRRAFHRFHLSPVQVCYSEFHLRAGKPLLSWRSFLLSASIDHGDGNTRERQFLLCVARCRCNHTWNHRIAASGVVPATDQVHVRLEH